MTSNPSIPATAPPPTVVVAPAPRKKWKAVLLLLLVFGLGCFVGGGGVALMALHRAQASFRNPAIADSAGAKFLGRVNRNIDKELKLNPEQQQAVREELDVTRNKLRELRVGLVRDLRALAADTLERISNRLPEEKRSILREKYRERLRPWGVEPPE